MQETYVLGGIPDWCVCNDNDQDQDCDAYHNADLATQSLSRQKQCLEKTAGVEFDLHLI